MKGHKLIIKEFSKEFVTALRIKDSAWYITFVKDDIQYTVFTYHNFIKNGNEYSVDVDYFAYRSGLQYFNPIVNRIVFRDCRFIFNQFDVEFEEFESNVEWREL